jgi:hypothetical protein
VSRMVGKAVKTKKWQSPNRVAQEIDVVLTQILASIMQGRLLCWQEKAVHRARCSEGVSCFLMFGEAPLDLKQNQYV